MNTQELDLATIFIKLLRLIIYILIFNFFENWTQIFSDERIFAWNVFLNLAGRRKLDPVQTRSCVTIYERKRKGSVARIRRFGLLYWMNMPNLVTLESSSVTRVCRLLAPLRGNKHQSGHTGRCVRGGNCPPGHSGRPGCARLSLFRVFWPGVKYALMSFIFPRSSRRSFILCSHAEKVGLEVPAIASNARNAGKGTSFFFNAESFTYIHWAKCQKVI